MNGIEKKLVQKDVIRATNGAKIGCLINEVSDLNVIRTFLKKGDMRDENGQAT